MNGVIPEVNMFAEAFLSPELHGLIAVLVGKYIDDIGLARLFRLLCLASGQSKQTGTAYDKIERMFHGSLLFEGETNCRLQTADTDTWSSCLQSVARNLYL